MVILDNFRSHWAKKTREKARELNITLVFLPPYSPDLNPIEFIWKSIKRHISPLFIETREMFLDTIQSVFYTLVQSLSFAVDWINEYLGISLICFVNDYNHTEEACDRYIKAYKKVEKLSKKMEPEEIARTLEMGISLVKEYISFITEEVN